MTSYHPYPEIIAAHQDPPSPDKYSALLLGYRNGFPSKENCESSADVQRTHLTYMDDSSNDFHSQPVINSTYKMCGGCGDRYWHNSCLKCHCCGAMLADVGTSCYTRRGLILCKKDYSSMFGCSGVCSGCGETIPPNELIAKAIPSLQSGDNQKTQKQNINCVFHLKCFTCTKCGSTLRPGDRYTMLGSNLVCEHDWQKLIKNSPTTNGNLPTRKGKVGRPRRAKE